MSNWSGLDFFIFLIFLVNTLLGMARGATKEIISTLALSIAFVFTIKFTIPITNFMNASPLIHDVISSTYINNFLTTIGLNSITYASINNISFILSMLICFVGIFSFCEGVIAYTGAITVFSFPYAVMDRKLGAAFGALRGYSFTVIFILIYLLLLPVPNDSYFINLFKSSSYKLHELVIRQKPEKYKEIFDKKDAFSSQMVIDALENPQK